MYYTFSVVYVFIRYWGPLKKAFVGMIVNTIEAPVHLHRLRGWSHTNDATIQGGPGVVGKELLAAHSCPSSILFRNFACKGH